MLPANTRKVWNQLLVSTSKLIVQTTKVNLQLFGVRNFHYYHVLCCVYMKLGGNCMWQSFECTVGNISTKFFSIEFCVAFKCKEKRNNKNYGNVGWLTIKLRQYWNYFDQSCWTVQEEVQRKLSISRSWCFQLIVSSMQNKSANQITNHFWSLPTIFSTRRPISLEASWLFVAVTLY